MTSIKTYPLLSRAILCDKKEVVCYLVWCVGRNWHDGVGGIPIDELRKMFKYSEQRFKQIIANGNDKYWSAPNKEGVIYFTGQRKLHERFQAPAYKHPALIPLSDTASIGKFKAALFATLFADNETTITHETLAKMYGVTRQTIIRWVKQAGITVTTNGMVTNKPIEDAVDPELAAEGYYRAWVNGTRRMVKKLPNTYSAPKIETTPFGQTKRNGVSSSTKAAGAPRRIYYANTKGIIKRLHGLSCQDRIYRLTEILTDDGRRLWEGYSGSPASEGIVTW
jgi:hypothetical protein